MFQNNVLQKNYIFRNAIYSSKQSQHVRIHSWNISSKENIWDELDEKVRSITLKDCFKMNKPFAKIRVV